MTNTATDAPQGSGPSLRECIAAWVVALTLLIAMVASSLVALLFDGWM